MLDALAAALVILSSGKASVPPRTAVRLDGGLLGVMPSHVPGVALESKLVSVFPGNEEHGLPSHQALIALFDENTGAPQALMDGTYITAIRTGGTAAVAARVLARQDAAVLSILGAGVQGWSHLETFPRVRDFREIRIASRNVDRARRGPRRHEAGTGQRRRDHALQVDGPRRRGRSDRAPRLRPRPRVGRRDTPAALEIDQARRHHVDDAGRLEFPLRDRPAEGMDVAVHGQQRVKALNETEHAHEPDMRRILRVG